MYFNHYARPSEEVNAWSNASAPPLPLHGMAWHRDNFSLTFPVFVYLMHSFVYIFNIRQYFLDKLALIRMSVEERSSALQRALRRGYIQ